MSDQAEQPKSNRLQGWLREHTRLCDFVNALFDEPSIGLSAWARTTAGMVSILIAVQITTGTLLAFYYVPSSDAAHMTVAYIEKVLPAGSWIRALHHYGSQWLTVVLVLHLTQMFWRASYKRKPVAWLSTVLLLALVLKGGVTGYSLPWDARAFFGTRVAEGIAGGIPFVGAGLQRWLVGGTEVSTITLSRFFALHVLIVPAFILLVIAARLFIFREPASSYIAQCGPGQTWKREQFTRQCVAAGLVFLALALYALKYHAPLGPAAGEATSGYMPRPGAQFLWLFQMLKYLPGGIASAVALILPGLIFIGLGALPFLDAKRRRKQPAEIPRRKLSVPAFALGCLFVAGMTALAYISDVRDPAIREQLARQAADEEAFRAEPFVPMPPRVTAANTSTTNSTVATARSVDNPPEEYLKKCANCHGIRGQGVKAFPTLVGVSTKPRRTVEDIISLLNDPVSFGLEPPMRSFATKLTENEKREIAEWLMLLKKP